MAHIGFVDAWLSLGMSIEAADLTVNLPLSSIVQTSWSGARFAGKMTLAIADIDSLSIIFERRSKFHVLEPYTIRSATFKGSQSILGSQGFSLKSAIHWIHGSFQKSIASPLLTTKQAPFRITHFSFSIAFHIGEAFLPGS